MRANILRTLIFLLLGSYFGRMNAQSDLLAVNSVTKESVPNEIIAKYNAEEKVKISDFMPNPANSNSMVSVNCINPVTIKVRFFTMNGDLAKEESHNMDKGVSTLNLDMNGLEKGIYMVQFYSKEGSAVRRLMKLN